MHAPEYMLQCGYYPDLFAQKDIPPDLFFCHVSGSTPESALWDFQCAVRNIVDSVKDKYKLDMGGPYSRPFNAMDCFWSASLPPDTIDGGAVYPRRYESLDDVPRYVGADDEYPVNPC